MLKENTRYEILTPNGFKDFLGIQRLEKSGYRFICDNGMKCEVSFGHKFIVNGNEILSDNVNIGDVLYYDGYNTIVVDIEKIENTFVYEPINVSNSQYIANGFLHHNCDFIGSSFTVIDAETLEGMLKTTKDPTLFDMKGKFRIFEKPQNGAEYVIGVDCAKGTGQDASVMQIFRIDSINPIKLTQVAVYEDNFVDVYTFAEIVHKTSYYYNSAYLMVENNGEGSAVTNRLWWDLENSNLVNTGTKERDLGIRATTTTKPKAVLFMKKLIEDGSVTIHDKPTVMQLTDFIDKGNNVYKCENLHDDLVTSMYWAFYFFEMNIMEEKYTFKEGEVDDDTWGVLTDVSTVEEDWSWL